MSRQSQNLDDNHFFQFISEIRKKGSSQSIFQFFRKFYAMRDQMWLFFSQMISESEILELIKLKQKFQRRILIDWQMKASILR